MMLVAILFTSCDFVRSIMGKPTTKELEKMRLEAVANAKKQRQIDSLNQVKAAEEALALKLAQEKAAAEAALKGRYFIVLGSFQVPDNATRMMTQLKKDGYKPQYITFKNGFKLIAAAAYDNYRKAFEDMDKFLEYDNCPEDVWIYDTTQNLHE